MSEEKKMTIEKPITIRILELKDGLQSLSVKSKLPPFLLEMIFSEYLRGISAVAKQEYAQDQMQWDRIQEQIKKEEKPGNNE